MRFPQDKILAAAFLFERTRGNEMADYELSEIERAEFDDSDADRVAMELVASVTGDASDDSGYCSSAYWALGKRYDPALVPFFKERLAVEVKRDAEAAYQVMIALGNLEEPVFSPSRSGYSVLDHELNRADAEAYLKEG